MSKVFVGLSGGVDSSVSAALLKEEGHDVTGVFIKTWHPDFLKCSWREDRQDAMDVCSKLGIPFMTLDLEEEYKRDVADEMIAEYAAGRTPNPDVLCNQRIKFGSFFEYARANGADFVATGHYARVREHNGTVELLAGVDANKDQSYFLWTIPQDVLRHVLFPVGNLRKGDVRARAERFGLSVAKKRDSQGVCFLGKVDMKEFLQRFVEAKRGNVVDERGVVIGEHDGALFYTLGQRHGFTVTKKSPNDGPWYIVAKDVATNTLTVSHSKSGITGSFVSISAELSNVRWVSGKTPEPSAALACRFRYRQALIPCTVSIRDETAIVSFAEPQPAVNEGQSLVVYDGETCLGGGVIQRTLAA